MIVATSTVLSYSDGTIRELRHCQRLKACTLASPEVGDLRPYAPTWCRAPFEPEGLLRTNRNGEWRHLLGEMKPCDSGFGIVSIVIVIQSLQLHQVREFKLHKKLDGKF
ncbi:hypothetical protein Tco_0637869 [Tanacetum coccineum]